VDASVELVRQLRSTVVHIRTEVPAEHPSARILGEERFGSGTVIDPSFSMVTSKLVTIDTSRFVALSVQRLPSIWIRMFWRIGNTWSDPIARFTSCKPESRSAVRQENFMITRLKRKF